jgi:DNA repair exonuclease SbcCD ATPase subunit
MRITEIQIEGFRGINRSITLPLDRGMVVISGPNGAGKTSVFQAVEWCLFGKLDLSGTEFQREDAIVNDFHAGEEARVILTLDDGTVVTRTRNKKARTSFGAKHDSKLTVVRSRKQLEDE